MKNFKYILLLYFLVLIPFAHADHTDIGTNLTQINNTYQFPIDYVEYDTTVTIMHNKSSFGFVNFHIEIIYDLPSGDQLLLSKYFSSNLIVVNNEKLCNVTASIMEKYQNKSIFNVDYLCEDKIKNLNILNLAFSQFFTDFNNKLTVKYRNETAEFNLNRTIVLASFNIESTIDEPITSTLIFTTTTESSKKETPASTAELPFSNYTFVLLSLLVLFLVYKYISSRNKQQFSWRKKSWFSVNPNTFLL